MRTAARAFSPLLGRALAGAGVPFVEGTIEDHPMRFVPDAGAREISIPYAEAVRMELPVSQGARLETTTAGGSVGVYRLTTGPVTVGGVSLHDVASNASESGLGVPARLLRTSFAQGGMVIAEPAEQ